MTTTKILGLDLGVASIGWAYIHSFDDPETDDEILAMGTRVVPYNPYNTGTKGNELEQFNKGLGYSTNQNRREKRGARRNFDRYILRREKLIRLLNEKGMYPNEELRLKLTATQLWQLRANAATEILPLCGAAARHIDGPLVGLVARVADLQVAEAREQMAVACVARRHHAVEHVDAGGHTFDQVFRRAHAHQVTRLVGRQAVRRVRHDALHLGLGLAHADTADRITR